MLSISVQWVVVIWGGHFCLCVENRKQKVLDSQSLEMPSTKWECLKILPRKITERK
jgi:hypothetical protein